MDLFQCVVPPRSKRSAGAGRQQDEDEDVYARQTRSVDRDLRDPRGRSIVIANDNASREDRLEEEQPFRERRQSVPPGYRLARRSQTPAMSRSRKVSMASNGNNGLKHWGSSVSLASDVSLNDLTRRTLRPPSPTTLSRARTPVSKASSPPPMARTNYFLPDTKMAMMNYPKLQDYLEKPRLVSTLGLGGVKARNPDMDFHAQRLAYADQPPYRNLRLGGFLENESESETIPEILRQYYLDTYLDDKVKFGQSGTLPSPPYQRGM